MKLIFLILFFQNISMASFHEPTLKEIEKTFGFVPKFYSHFPEVGVIGAWEEMKNLELNPNTALSGLHKELIGLAVASQIPCSYCIYFHKKVARFNGGISKQIREAIALASLTRFWATFFNGMQVDFEEFKKEVDEMVKKKKKGDRDAEVISITDAESVYKDVEKEMGIIPNFIKLFPKASLPGAWREIKGLEMNPNTALPGKIKALISLAVAAQIPCKYCIYWDTEFAKLEGASEQEIAEAVEMAATTRHWSTWLNGNRFSEKAFKKEVNKIISKLSKN